MNNNFWIFSVLLLAALVAFSGCGRKVSENTNKSADVEAKISKNEAEVETIESDIDTSDWLTYRNEEYGFEVKYPSNFYKIPSSTDLPEIYFATQRVEAPLEMGIKDLWLTVGFEKKENIEDLYAFVRSRLGRNQYRVKNVLKEFQINDQSVYQVTTQWMGGASDSGEPVITYIQKGKIIYFIEALFFSEKHFFDSYYDEYNTIIKSFRVL